MLSGHWRVIDRCSCFSLTYVRFSQLTQFMIRLWWVDMDHWFFLCWFPLNGLESKSLTLSWELWNTEIMNLSATKIWKGMSYRVRCRLGHSLVVMANLLELLEIETVNSSMCAISLSTLPVYPNALGLWNRVELLHLIKKLKIIGSEICKML